MARPPLPLGTQGRIRIYRTTNGYRARTLVRDYDGRTRQLERNGPTKTAAETALKIAVRDRGRVGDFAEITPDSRVKDTFLSYGGERSHPAQTLATLHDSRRPSTDQNRFTAADSGW